MNKPISLYLDDVRPMPPEFDVCAKTAREAMDIIINMNVYFISFDHDLGDEANGTGYDVACFIEERAITSGIKPPIGWECHSSNPYGRDKINATMKSAWKYYESSCGKD